MPRVRSGFFCKVIENLRDAAKEEPSAELVRCPTVPSAWVQGSPDPPRDWHAEAPPPHPPPFLVF